MTTFDDREQAFEAKFARDEEVAFRVSARRNRLLGQWAEEKMKLTAEEALEVTKIYSVAGLLGENQTFVAARPFRVAH